MCSPTIRGSTGLLMRVSSVGPPPDDAIVGRGRPAANAPVRLARGAGTLEPMHPRLRSAALVCLLASATPPWTFAQAAASQVPPIAEALPAPARIAAVHEYITRTWTTLRRSLRDLPAAARDPKLHLPSGSRWPVYFPAVEDKAAIDAALRSQLTERDLASIDLRPLPKDPGALREHGLLYLPHPYVVPGGRFNEMYGWDSYFIVLGLLRDDQVGAARDMVDNFLYEIEKYGTILNANRTYYLTRSQPPFLTRMLLDVFAR